MSVYPDRRFSIQFDSGDQRMGLNFGSVQQVTVDSDYNRLIHKPSINGVELTGNQTTESLNIHPLPEGGQQGDVLMLLAPGAPAWQTPASSAEQDNTLPITAAAVYTEIGNINALLATI